MIKSYPKHKRVKNKKYLRWVSTLPCLICERHSDTVVPHHVYQGSKKSDDQVVALCVLHHAENASNYSVHHLGKKKFEAMFKVDLDFEADTLYKEWGLL